MFGLSHIPLSPLGSENKLLGISGVQYWSKVLTSLQVNALNYIMTVGRELGYGPGILC